MSDDVVSAEPAGRVVVVGSANLDLVAQVQQIPAPGSTVLTTAPREPAAGGKGLNQAVASARAGARTQMVLAVGEDDAGDTLLGTLVDAGVDVSLARRVPGPTGSAWILVQPDGENAIVVDAAANRALEALTEPERAAVGGADVLVCQLEIPLETVTEAVRAATGAGRTVVLNAAPARELPDALLGDVDVLVVNEHEAAELSGEDAPRAAAPVLGRLAAAVVVTLGAAGALVHDADGTRAVPGVRADVVDTTGAGDTFTGVLAAGLARGDDLDASARRAAAAAALAVEGRGAVPSIPTADRIDERARRAAAADGVTG